MPSKKEKQCNDGRFWPTHKRGMVRRSRHRRTTRRCETRPSNRSTRKPIRKKYKPSAMNFLPTFQAYPMAINVEIKQESVPAHNLFNCGFCNQTFRSKKELKEHKQQRHQQVKVARKSKTEAGPPSYHVNFVPHQPKFQCEYCFKGFDQSHRLKQHQISHREPIFHCDQVSDNFRRN